MYESNNRFMGDSIKVFPQGLVGKLLAMCEPFWSLMNFLPSHLSIY